MFGVSDHIIGAVSVRLRRIIFRLMDKADISYVNPNLGVGGVCSIKSLLKENIHTILDLRGEAEHSPEELKKFSIYYLRLEVNDRGVPNLASAIKVIKWVKLNLDQDKKVFIHCNLGRGRAPLLATIYLISQGMKSENAIRLIKETRIYSYFNNKQLQWIKEFENNKNSNHTC